MSPNETKLKPPHKDDAKELKPTPFGPVEVGLVLAGDRSHLDAQLSALATLLVGAGFLSLLGTVLFVILVLRRDLVPLRQLAAQAENIHAALLQARFSTDHLPAELAPIVHRLNDLLSRLETSFDRERRCSADLAHELRTPLTGLRAVAEVGLKWGEPADKESFQTILDVVRQMEKMMTRLLALARSEQKMILLQSESVAVSPLVDSLWQPLREKSALRQLTVRIDVPAEANIATDPEFLRGILQNLFSNAVEYTPPGGLVDVAFTQMAGRFTLTVVNSITNLEPADVPSLFERFWRKETSRASSAHSGLGLPLAKSFAELLGFELRAALKGNPQLTLTLSGPLESCRPRAECSGALIKFGCLGETILAQN